MDWLKYQDESTSWWEKTMTKRYHHVGLTTSSPLDCAVLTPAEHNASAYMCEENQDGNICNFECMPGSCRVEALKKQRPPSMPPMN